MRSLIFIIIITQITTQLLAQEKTKRVNVNHNFTLERYRVLKSDKSTRHGEYTRSTVMPVNLLEKGIYDHGNKVDIWKYYFRTSDEPILEQVFDHSNDSLIYLHEPDKVYEEEFGKQPLESDIFVPAIHIGGQEHLHNIIVDEIDKYLKNSKKKIESVLATKQNGIIIIAFTVDENGNMISPVLEFGYHPDCIEITLNAVKSLNTKWIPAELNGKKVVDRRSVTITYTFNESYGSKGTLQQTVFIDRIRDNTGWARKIK